MPLKDRKIVAEGNNFGYVAGDGEFVPVTDFVLSIKCATYNEDTRKSGYLVQVSRDDGKTGDAMFEHDSLRDSHSLTTSISRSFGGNLLCSFISKSELFVLMNKLNKDMVLQHNEANTKDTKKIVTIAGEQPDGTYMFNPDQAFSKAGEKLPITDYIWHRSWEECPSPCTYRLIEEPLGLEPMVTLLNKIVMVTGRNAAATIMALADMYLKHNYNEILQKSGHVSLTVLYGKPHTGKTLAAKVAAKACGATETLLYSRCTLSHMQAIITGQTMPIVWDDPSIPEDVGQVAVDIHNGGIRGKGPTSTCIRKVRTAPLVTANFDMKAIPRFFSRLVVWPFESLENPVYGQDEDLLAVASLASASLPLLLGEISNISREDISSNVRWLQSVLPTTDLRLTVSMAYTVEMAQKIISLCGDDGVMDMVRDWIETELAAYYTGDRETLDTLEPLIQKMTAIPHQELLELATIVKGEMVAIRVREMAVAIGWQESDVRSLLLKCGGQPRVTARFSGMAVPKKCIGLNLGILSTQQQTELLKAINSSQTGKQAYHCDETECQTAEAERALENTESTRQEQLNFGDSGTIMSYKARKVTRSATGLTEAVPVVTNEFSKNMRRGSQAEQADETTKPTSTGRPVRAKKRKQPMDM